MDEHGGMNNSPPYQIHMALLEVGFTKEEIRDLARNRKDMLRNLKTGYDLAVKIQIAKSERPELIAKGA